MSGVTSLKFYECDVCDVICSEIDTLRRHVLIHPSKQPFKCEECGVTFSYKTYLKRHILTHKRKKHYECNECQSNFRTKVRLHEHKRIHQRKKAFKCDVCGVAFTYQKNLAHHIAIHKKGIAYHCNACDAAFVTRTHLVAHNHMHTSKRHECNICSAAFKNRKLLGAHCKSSHAKTKSPTGKTSSYDVSSNTGALKNKVLHHGLRSLGDHVSETSIKRRSSALQPSYFVVSAPKAGGTGDDFDINEDTMVAALLNASFIVIPEVEDRKLAFDIGAIQDGTVENCTTAHSENGASISVSLSENSVMQTRIGKVTNDSVSNNDNSQMCTTCKLVFSSNDKLAGHKCTRPAEKSVYSCDLCNNAFSKEHDFIEHTRSHTERLHSCDKCGARFAEKQFLEIHVALHNNGKRHKCFTCGSAFMLESSLQYHVCEHNIKQGDSKVEKSKIKQEVVVEESTDNDLCRYKCDSCCLKFQYRSQYKRHTRKHLGEAPYGCDICGEAYVKKSFLERHMLFHVSQEPYSCTICSAKFKYKRRLKDHSLVHTPTGNKQFECDICEAQFILEVNLQEHVRTHTGQKPYLCNLCGMAFTFKRNVRKHQRLHCGSRKCNAKNPPPSKNQRCFTISHN